MKEKTLEYGQDTLLYSHLPVNWEDGMVVSAQHLSDANKYIIGSVLNSRLIQTNPVNYGLLPCYFKAHIYDDTNAYHALKFASKSDNPNIDYFTVRLTHCNAILPSSQLIHITPDTIRSGKYDENDLTDSIKPSESSYDEGYILVYLEVEPTYSPVGNLKDDEEFNRQPYLNTKAHLKHTFLRSSEQIEVSNYLNSDNQLPLRIYRFNSNSCTLITTYIPPCTSINASKNLIKYYNEFGEQAKTLLNSLTETLKYSHSEPSKYSNMGIFLPPIVSALVQIIAKFNGHLKYALPIEIVEVFKSLAIAIYSSYYTLNENNRKELEHYFNKFRKPTNKELFIESVNAFIRENYMHNNCDVIFKKVQALITESASLFEEVSKHGLEPHAIPIDVDPNLGTKPKRSETDKSGEAGGRFW